MPKFSDFNLYLIGMPGSGKSRAGRFTAAELHWPHLDLDEEIVRRVGASIEELLAPDSRYNFRELETAVLASIGAGEGGRVVSLGGGTPLLKSNRQLMSDSGITVWITASVEAIAARLRKSPHVRPLLGRDFSDDDLQALLRKRRGAYEKAADFKVESGDLCYREIAAILRREIGFRKHRRRVRRGERDKTAELHFDRGNQKGALGNYAEAVEDYSKVIAIDSGHADAYCNRGNAKSCLELYSEAISDYDMAIELSPDDAALYTNRANAKLCLERYAEAVKDYDKALQLNPNDKAAHKNRNLARSTVGAKPAR